jgi:hypothetical protein
MDAVLSVCSTWCMPYLVYAVLGVCYTRCQLMIMTWQNRAGWLSFVFCDDFGVVDEKDRDMEWRWERRGGYKRIWVRRGTTSRIGLGWPHIDVITWRIGTCPCCIRDSKLSHTRNCFLFHLFTMCSPMLFPLGLSSPQFSHHLRTRS